MVKINHICKTLQPFAEHGEPGRNDERRRISRSGAPLPWKLAIPLIVALSMALWMVIIFAAERLITAII